MARAFKEDKIHFEALELGDVKSLEKELRGLGEKNRGTIRKDIAEIDNYLKKKDPVKESKKTEKSEKRFGPHPEQPGIKGQRNLDNQIHFR